MKRPRKKTRTPSTRRKAAKKSEPLPFLVSDYGNFKASAYISLGTVKNPTFNASPLAGFCIRSTIHNGIWWDSKNDVYVLAIRYNNKPCWLIVDSPFNPANIDYTARQGEIAPSHWNFASAADVVCGFTNKYLRDTPSLKELDADERFDELLNLARRNEFWQELYAVVTTTQDECKVAGGKLEKVLFAEIKLPDGSLFYVTPNGAQADRPKTIKVARPDIEDIDEGNADFLKLVSPHGSRC